MSANLTMLSKFPAVQVFSMSGWGILADGPGPCVQSARLDSAVAGIYANHITSLDATFDSFDNAALGTLSGFFPRLTELRIRINFEVEDGAFEDDVNPQATTFFEALAETPTLPPTLERLALCWAFEYEDPENAPTADELPEFAELRDALVVRCPGLTVLWLDGHEFLFRWRKSSLDGTVDEGTADDAYDAEVMCADFAAFWETR
ncbi:hypothetical protein B0H10DRAFT_2206623 [Mycena sp. CBHHK59/15]|nr:hypothetical protein B0H10DRAFT_2206623 [Mycena sp. CBHHK59/15]